MSEEITRATKGNQRARIMAHLQTGKTLTRLEALREYGIVELPARISELRRQGKAIIKVTREGVNKYGEVYRYAEYSLKEKKA